MGIDALELSLLVESALHDAFVSKAAASQSDGVRLEGVVAEVRACLPEAQLHELMEVAWEHKLRTAPRAYQMSYDDVTALWNDAVDLCRASDAFRRRFHVIGQIGAGSFAAVQVAYDRDRRHNVALKVYDAASAGKALAEVAIWSKCKHESIISVHETIFTPTEVFVSLELAPGGELLNKLDEVQRFDEAQACDTFRQIVAAIEYLHETAGVAHLDLKPENLLCTSQEHGLIGQVKVSDFNFATRIITDDTGEPLSGSAGDASGDGENGSSLRPRSMSATTRLAQQLVGTPDYTSPEQVRIYRQRAHGTRAGAAEPTAVVEAYTEKVDLWALGCIAHELLTGSPPFSDPDDEVLNELILSQPVDMEGEVWQTVSASAKDLISKLLERNPEKRLSAKQALAHPWLSSNVPVVPELQELRRQESRTLNRHKTKQIRRNRRFRVNGLAVHAVTRIVSNRTASSPPSPPARDRGQSISTAGSVV